MEAGAVALDGFSWGHWIIYRKQMTSWGLLNLSSSNDLRARNIHGSYKRTQHFLEIEVHIAENQIKCNWEGYRVATLVEFTALPSFSCKSQGIDWKRMRHWIQKSVAMLELMLYPSTSILQPFSTAAFTLNMPWKVPIAIPSEAWAHIQPINSHLCLGDLGEEIALKKSDSNMGGNKENPESY